VVVDTSAWVEWLINSPTGQILKPYLPRRDEWIVPTIVQLELARWLIRESGEAEAESAIAYTEKCVVRPLTTEISISAAKICITEKLAMADAVIYATALECGSKVVTCDAHFSGLRNVIYVPKARQ
jgi:predicted nucleic acid-binding protein